MADGITHERWRKMGFLPIAIIALGAAIFSLKDPFYLYCSISILWNYLLTAFIGPDLDQISLGSQDAKMIWRIPILGFLGFIWWSTYAYIMAILTRKHSAHRSWLTHSIIPGTLIRMAWHNLPIGAVLYLASLKFDIWFMLPFAAPYLIGQFIAWSVTDLIHLILDRSPQYATNQQRSLGRRYDNRRYNNEHGHRPRRARTHRRI